VEDLAGLLVDDVAPRLVDLDLVRVGGDPVLAGPVPLLELLDVGGRLRVQRLDGLLVVLLVRAKLVELAGAPKKGVVVDLSSVNFLASIGIRALITSANAVQQRGGKMVLVVSKGSQVTMSLEATGIDSLIPVFDNASAAERAAVA